MTYPIIVVPDEAGESIEQLGTKRKFWFNDKRLLFKQGRPGTGENWAEKVACELCGLLQLPHAHYDLAVWRGQPGVVTTSFLPPQWRLVHGNELLARIYPDYLTNQRYKRRQHLEAFASARRLRGGAATFWLERLASLGPADFEAIFQPVPPDLISDAAIDFAMRMLDSNRARLLGLAGR